MSIAAAEKAKPPPAPSRRLDRLSFSALGWVARADARPATVLKEGTRSETAIRPATSTTPMLAAG